MCIGSENRLQNVIQSLVWPTGKKTMYMFKKYMLYFKYNNSYGIEKA